jgi:hypothetical protein
MATMINFMETEFRNNLLSLVFWLLVWLAVRNFLKVYYIK